MAATSAARPHARAPIGAGLPTVRPGSPERPAAVSGHAAAPMADAAIAEALRMLWTAVHHHAEDVHATLNSVPPRKAIDAWGGCAHAFEAVATLADVLGVDLHVADGLCRHAPLWTRR